MLVISSVVRALLGDVSAVGNNSCVVESGSAGVVGSSVVAASVESSSDVVVIEFVDEPVCGVVDDVVVTIIALG
ncbi:hypothetical protein N4Q63_26590, partial [Leclercia adecarboxylata]|nr:hypothetical protein [Leclercia adecarboxylata]